MKMTTELKTIWDNQYTGDGDTALKDRNLFRLEIQAIIKHVENNLAGREEIALLELGCGTGYLIKEISNHFAPRGIKVISIGVDFSENAIAEASQRNVPFSRFISSDFFAFFNETKTHFDFIITQRSLMALLTRTDQKALLALIKASLAPNGIGIFSECFEEQYIKMNSLRKIMGVGDLVKVWHSMYLCESDLTGLFSTVEFDDFCSSYMLITRIIYPYFEDPLHNQKIHDLAASFPQCGDFGFLRIAKVGP